MILESIAKKRGAAFFTFEGGALAAFDPKIAARYRPGDSIPSSAFEENASFAYTYGLAQALGYLKQARTEAAVEKRLERIGVLPAERARILAYLKEKRYVDDKEYALLYRMGKSEAGFSQKDITQRLKRRGIPKAVAEEGEGGADNDAAALAVFIARQAQRNKGVPPSRLKRALYEKALRKGFSSDAISEALRQADFSEEGDYSAWLEKSIAKRLLAFRRKGLGEEAALRRVAMEFREFGLSEEDCAAYAGNGQKWEGSEE